MRLVLCETSCKKKNCCNQPPCLGGEGSVFARLLHFSKLLWRYPSRLCSKRSINITQGKAKTPKTLSAPQVIPGIPTCTRDRALVSVFYWSHLRQLQCSTLMTKAVFFLLPWYWTVNVKYVYIYFLWGVCCLVTSFITLTK